MFVECLEDPHDMTPSEAIIVRLGGVRAAARVLGKSPSTIQDWKRSGLIPAKHQVEVFTLAREAGVKLDADEFLFARPAARSTQPQPLSPGPETTGQLARPVEAA